VARAPRPRKPRSKERGFLLHCDEFLGSLPVSLRGAFISSNAIQPGQDYSIGPTLPAEMPKAPFRPKVAGKIAFFFGPVAGALVTVINLRRTGYPLKAKRVLLWTLVGAAVLAAILVVIPDVFGRLVGLGAEFAFYKIYPDLQEKEFDGWQSANPDIQPLNGWKSLGWGFAGLVIFLAIFFVVAFPLFLLFPSLG